MLRNIDQLIILSREDFIVYIDLEIDALIARVQLISYRYILL